MQLEDRDHETFVENSEQVCIYFREWYRLLGMEKAHALILVTEETVSQQHSTQSLL